MTAGVKLKKADVEKALRTTHGNYQLSAQMLKCTRDGIRLFVDRHPDLKALVEEERGGCIDVAESALQRAVLNGESWAIAFTLKTIGRHRGYVERTEQEISGKDGERLVIKVVTVDGNGTAQD